jgi:hypothetical protein
LPAGCRTSAIRPAFISSKDSAVTGFRKFGRAKKFLGTGRKTETVSAGLRSNDRKAKWLEKGRAAGNPKRFAKRQHQHPASSSMKTPRSLQRISAGISLLILASGFSSLGILSFIGTYEDSSVHGFSLSDTYSLAGSAISMIAGAMSLLNAFLY